jgi:hypothetical protein
MKFTFINDLNSNIEIIIKADSFYDAIDLLISTVKESSDYTAIKK